MKNLPIIVKFLGIMGFFGLFALGVAYYATSQMHLIDRNYNGLINGPEQAALGLARSDRDFQTAQGGIAELLISTTNAGNAAALKTIIDSTTEFTNNMDKAAGLAPDHATDIEALKENDLDVLNNQCKATVAAAATATTAAQNAVVQAQFLSDCAPLFGPAGDALKQEAMQITSDASQRSLQLSGVTANTILTTYGGILGGLLLVLGFGFFAIRGWVVQPVRDLQGVMARLASGDFKTKVVGADREDEIGGMARAVQVFNGSADYGSDGSHSRNVFSRMRGAACRA